MQELIKEYTQHRLKECLLNPEFAKEVKGNNGHIFTKMLKEQVNNELKLSSAAKLSDFAFTK